MTNLATTKMSSKGQVVIPEAIRAQLQLESGTQFIVLGERDVVILKKISPPSLHDFNHLIDKVRDSVAVAGLSQLDLDNAIEEVRKK